MKNKNEQNHIFERFKKMNEMGCSPMINERSEKSKIRSSPCHCYR